MQVYTSFADINRSELGNCILTIGNFDGVHLGHQKVLAQLTERAKKHHAKSVVLTFKNHPSDILRPHLSVAKICTLEHKLHLLASSGIDAVILLEFTLDFSQQTVEEFLEKIYQAIDFNYLILGHDATIGKNREGNRQRVEEYAKHHHFEVEYVEPLIDGEQPVSSSRIRKHIQAGELTAASQLLGRPYSIQSNVITGLAKGKEMGFPTANLDITGLCLPPLGVYRMIACYQNQQYPAVANLGKAPTVRSDEKTLLEVHVLNQELKLTGQTFEGIFCEYIRPEKKFENLDQLKKQIEADTQYAIKAFGVRRLAVAFPQCDLSHCH